MSRIFRILSFLALAAVLILSLKSFNELAGTALKRESYAWLDEGLVLKPALQVKEKGYFGYRCSENSPAPCYGPTQVFLDALTLKLLPKTWFEHDQLHKLPGTDWFFLTQYPEALRTLRLSRVAYALFLVLFLLIFARVSGMNAEWALLISLGITLFPAFTHARLGLKNDFPSALWMIGFMFAAHATLTRLKSPLISQLFPLSIVIGVLACGVRLSVAPILAFYCLYVAAMMKVEGFAWSRVYAEMRNAFGVIIWTWILINPNIIVSSTEASFIGATIKAGDIPWELHRLKTEFLTTAWQNLWPYALTVLLFFGFLLRMGFRRAMIEHGFFVFAPLLIILPTLKAGWLRPHYYLPVLIWSIVTGLMMWRELRTRLKFLLPVLLWTIIVATVVSQPYLWAEIQSPIEWKKWDDSPIPLDFTLNTHSAPNRKLVLDLQLRPPLRQDKHQLDQILFFDSLSDSPQMVRQWAMERWKESENDITIFAACWDATSDYKSNPSLYSPAALAWAEIMKGQCQRRDPIDFTHVYSFERGTRVSQFGILPFRDLEIASKVMREKIGFEGEKLSPRMFTGAHQGLDYWYAPLVLYKNTDIEVDLKWPKGLEKVKIPALSTCKDSAGLFVDIIPEKGKSASKILGLDVTEKTCTEYGWVCDLHMEYWWMKRYAVGPLEIPVHVPPGTSAKIKISVRGLSADTCRLSLLPLEFEYAKVGETSGPAPRGRKKKN